jgi:hypothetical protein
MLYREVIPACSEIHTKHIILYVQFGENTDARGSKNAAGHFILHGPLSNHTPAQQMYFSKGRRLKKFYCPCMVTYSVSQQMDNTKYTKL